MNPPSIEEVIEEIKRLEQLTEQIPNFSPFEDDNKMAIAWQLLLLTEEASMTELAEALAADKITDHTYDNAAAAHNWRVGREIIKPSDEWEQIINDQID